MRARWVVVGITCALLFAVRSGSAYSPIGRQWTPGTGIVMQLQQGTPGAALVDGSPDWDLVTADALTTWNTVLGGVSFAATRDTAAPPAIPNDVNDVIWGDDVYGDPFGDGVVAITVSLYRVDDNITTEADVIFNRKYRWDSYRGNMRRASDGSALVDLRRVALHEFGHVLGLNHPDDSGQTVRAIMNSHTGDIDRLQQDDVDGVTSIYGPAKAADTMQSRGPRFIPHRPL